LKQTKWVSGFPGGNSSHIRLEGKDDDDDALVGDGLKVGADLILDEAFAAAGAIRLIGADIAGQLSCSGASLNGVGSDGGALIADTIKIGGGMFLNEHFTADGAIRLMGADRRCPSAAAVRAWQPGALTRCPGPRPPRKPRPRWCGQGRA
jgi:hypothetical protein